VQPRAKRNANSVVANAFQDSTVFSYANVDTQATGSLDGGGAVNANAARPKGTKAVAARAPSDAGGGYHLASIENSGGVDAADDAGDAHPNVGGSVTRITPPRHRGGSGIEDVDAYLWEVYQRAPVKSDNSGDFSWKDAAAAKHAGMSLEEYVIGGMDPDFKEQIYHAGRAMDADGIHWSMLSAFRDNYRQALASGFKAHGGNSLHGGTSATGGYGHGRAIDITNADGARDVVWRWLDQHGAKYGLYRPMPGYDPAHTQSRGAWHELAASLRNARTKVADGGTPNPHTKVVSKGGGRGTY
jgi:hypothetical protein